MIILAHRGYWTSKDEQNTAAAIERAFLGGYGVETDLRDRDGTVVVSHDPARGGELSLEALLSIADRHPEVAVLALNIKADGLQSVLEPALRRRRDYFLFDMAVPDMVASLRLGLVCFTRQSDIEREPVLLDDVDGVWLDAFHSETLDVDVIRSLLAANKKVAIVSPELHGRSRHGCWARLRELGLHNSSNVRLCTDFPDQAARYFRGAS